MTLERASLKSKYLPIGVILLAYLVLGVIYSVITPIFEASDEICHYPVVHHIATGYGLPVQDPASPGLWRQEGSQPPLYYVLSALLVRWIDLSDFSVVYRRNPHADIGVITTDGNVNMAVHTEREAFPYHGTTLAVHLIRWLSVLMGAATVVVTHAVAQTVFPAQPHVAPLAAALTAFNPMFLFISGSVNNDNLVVLLTTLALLLILRLDEGVLSFLRMAWLGLLIGVAILTKVSAVGLLPLTGLTLLILCIRRHNLYPFIWGGTTLILTVLAVTGWWFWRNWQLYGEPLGLRTMVAIAGPRHPRPNLLQLAAEWQGFVWSFWGLFGGLNVAYERWTYELFNAVAILAGIGLCVFAYRLARGRLAVNYFRLVILITWPIIVGIALVRWTLMTQASQGRLMFPALAALSVLMAIGLLQVPRRFQPAWGILLGTLFLVLATIAPFRIIGPAYARPQLLPVDSVPNRLNVTFGDKIQLLGYQLDHATVVPGDKLELTLYWQSLSSLDRNYSLFIHLLGEHDIVLAQRDTYPGRGLFPTSEWVPGRTFGDRVALTIPPSAYAPDQAHIELGFYDFETGQRLPAIDKDARPLGDNVRFASIQVQPVPGNDLPNPVRYSFEDGIDLVGYSVNPRGAFPGDVIHLTLYWKAKTPIRRDYTVFAHVLGESERMWAQRDSQPQNGTAPTSTWKPDTIIEDQLDLRLQDHTPPGLYDVEVGLYWLQTGQRLGILRGGRLEADRVLLTRVRVYGR